MSSKAQVDASAKYNKNNYFHFNARFFKSDEDYIRYAIKKSGLSMNTFIQEAVMDKIASMVEDGIIGSSDEFYKSDDLIAIREESEKMKKEVKTNYGKYKKVKTETEENISAASENTEEKVSTLDTLCDPKVENETSEKQQNIGFGAFLAQKRMNNTGEEARKIQEEKARIWAQEEANSSFRPTSASTSPEVMAEFIKNNN